MGGGLFRAPPLFSRNYWTDCKNSSDIWNPWKNCWRKTNFIDLGVTSDVTGKVKVKMFDISGLVDIGEQNCDVKHKQSQLIGMNSVSDICKYHLLCFATIIEVKIMSGHQVKKVKQFFFSWFRASIHVFRSDFRKEREKWPCKTFWSIKIGQQKLGKSR